MTGPKVTVVRRRSLVGLVGAVAWRLVAVYVVVAYYWRSLVILVFAAALAAVVVVAVLAVAVVVVRVALSWWRGW